MSKEETVEVTVNLPKKIVGFLKDMEKVTNIAMDDYLRNRIIGDVYADLETRDFFVPTPSFFVDKYGLKKVFKESGFDPESLYR